MSNEPYRKALRAAYKERKQRAGVYVLRCVTSGRAWVGRSPNLDAVENRIWFALQAGGPADAQLRADWQAGGREAFEFEVLETVPDEEDPYLRMSILKERALYWRARLGAAPA